MSEGWKQVRVGVDPNLTEIGDCLSKSPSASVLWQKLPDVARDLDFPNFDSIFRDVKIVRSNSYLTYLNEILINWNSMKSEKATLENLIEVLKKYDLNDSADTLLRTFQNKLSDIPNVQVREFTKIDEEEKVQGKEEKNEYKVGNPMKRKYENAPNTARRAEENPQQEVASVNEGEAETGITEEKLMRMLELSEPEMRKLLDFEEDKTPLKVIVKKPPQKVDYDERPYNLPPSSVGLKGYALILNIIEFEHGSKSRKLGGTLDMEYMKELWKQLGYQIFPSEEDLKKEIKTKDDILRMIKEFKESCEKGKPKSIIVYIGSHGGWDTICTSDADKEGNEITIKLYNEIIDEFSNAKFKNQRKILPKIFLIQACQDHQRNSIDNIKPPGHIDDTVVCTAQVPGASANRDYHKGSWFVYCLTWVFMNKAHKCTLDEMLTMVDLMMRNIKGNATKSQIIGVHSYGMQMQNNLRFCLDP